MRRTTWLAATALAIAGCAAAPQRAPSPRTLDTIFEDAMTRYRLPGLVLGVVVDGEVVYARAAGETVAGSGQPVTADTLFKIASNSKAMTTGVLARLVDAGKLRWTDPVVKYLPGFRMYDPWVTREMQVRDLLIHNSGLRSGAGDLMLWPEPNLFTRADVIAGLAHLKPVSSFRSRYDYDNLMYIVAGEVAAAVAGVPYEELVRRELFEPLGMTRCQAGEFRRDDVGNVAQPHMRQGEGNVPIRRDGEVIPASTLAAAGGIRCSLNDMLKWTRMWLDPDLKPAPGAPPWLTRAQRDALWAPHTIMPISLRQRVWDESRFYAYGYGWRVSDVRGVWRVAHTGTLAGMYSSLILLPERRVGIVFMTNGNGADARTVLSHVLVQHFVSPRTVKTVGAYAQEIDDERARRAPPPTSAPAITPRTPASAAELARWLGVYHDPWFGEVSVCSAGERVRFASLKSPRLAGDVFREGERLVVDWADETVDTDAWLMFTRSGQTAPVTLTLAKVDPDADFSNDFEDLFLTRMRDCPALSGGSSVERDIDALMRAYQGESPGAALLVLRDGAPLVRKAYGLADLEARVASTPTTNYRLASVTKQFTAAAIQLLAQRGRLSLDDRARKWLPSLPGAAKAVTIRHLLTHTSGLVDYEDVMPAGLTVQLRDADVLRLLETQHRTYFPPGTGYRYSNTGYALLALIVERASGKTFATFLREEIFVPLGMLHTVAFEDGVSAVANRAYGYSETANGWSRTDQSLTSAVLGDGGVYSSIDDLAKWDAALYDGRLLSAASLRAAFAPATATDVADVEYGFGWRITGETLWHSGETIGFRNVIVRYPRKRLTVVLLTNRNDPEPYQTALAIGRFFLP